jgi:hypothetical protein
MKRAHICAVLYLDLCDLQKVGQIKNPGIMSCILIKYPNQESDWTEIWSVSYSYLVVHM